MPQTIICFGKNYRDHMHELGDKVVDKPVIFLKPISVLRECKNWAEKIALYSPNEEIHYECELIFKLDAGGFALSAEQARQALGWYTVGLDMTKRNLQKQLKEAGHPWTTAKVFPDAAVIGPWLPIDHLETVLLEKFQFQLNGELRQSSSGNKMIFSPIDLLVYVSQFFPVSAGDIIFTGTPAGVGKVKPTDSAKISIGENFYSVTWV